MSKQPTPPAVSMDAFQDAARDVLKAISALELAAAEYMRQSHSCKDVARHRFTRELQEAVLRGLPTVDLPNGRQLLSRARIHGARLFPLSKVPL